MLKMSEFKGTRALLGALLVMTLSCSTANRQQAPFASEGRGAAATPSIPWEMWRNPADIEAVPPPEIKGYPEQHWLVGPLDGPATGGRLVGFLGAASNGGTPEEIQPLPVDIFTSKDFYSDRALWT